MIQYARSSTEVGAGKNELCCVAKDDFVKFMSIQTHECLSTRVFRHAVILGTRTLIPSRIKIRVPLCSPLHVQWRLLVQTFRRRSDDGPLFRTSADVNRRCSRDKINEIVRSYRRVLVAGEMAEGRGVFVKTNSECIVLRRHSSLGRCRNIGNASRAIVRPRKRR